MALLIQNSNGLSASVLQTLRSNSESFLKENKLYTLDPTSKGTIIHTLKYTSGYIFRTEISSSSDSNGFYNVYWQEHIYYDSTLLKIDNINYKLDLFTNLNDYIFGRFNILYGNGTALDKANDIIDFSVAPDFLSGYNAGGGDDVLLGSSGTDLFYGGVGNDLIDGSADHDTIYGNIGDDQLIGGTGNDYLVGDLGNDWLNGGKGDDTLIGGLGDDIIEGGEGNDVVVFSGPQSSYKFTFYPEYTIVQNVIDGTDLLRSVENFYFNHSQSLGSGYTPAQMPLSSSQPFWKVRFLNIPESGSLGGQDGIKGGDIQVEVSTQNVEPSTPFSFSLKGLDPQNIFNSNLSGNGLLDVSGKAVFNIPISNNFGYRSDSPIEIIIKSDQSIKASARGFLAGHGGLTYSNPFYISPINDSAMPSLVKVNEGEFAVVNLKYTDKIIPKYAVIPYTIEVSDLSMEDIYLNSLGVYGKPATTSDFGYGGEFKSESSGKSLKGVAKIDADGTIKIQIPIRKDYITEGSEYFFAHIYLPDLQYDKRFLFEIIDSSNEINRVGMKLSVVASRPTFSEGDTVTFSVVADGFVDSSSLRYELSGIDLFDTTLGTLSGQLTLNSQGFASVEIPTLMDFATEGTEQLSINIRGVSASVSVLDTSTAPGFGIVNELRAVTSKGGFSLLEQKVAFSVPDSPSSRLIKIDGVWTQLFKNDAKILLTWHQNSFLGNRALDGLSLDIALGALDRGLAGAERAAFIELVGLIADCKIVNGVPLFDGNFG